MLHTHVNSVSNHPVATVSFSEPSYTVSEGKQVQLEITIDQVYARDIEFTVTIRNIQNARREWIVSGMHAYIGTCHKLLTKLCGFVA